MAQVLVRNLDPEIVERLKSRARAHGRSLQAEVAEILTRAARQLTTNEAHALALDYQRRFAGRTFSDSAELIREDRDR